LQWQLLELFRGKFSALEVGAVHASSQQLISWSLLLSSIASAPGLMLRRKMTHAKTHATNFMG
jgi:hypothetical protein